VIFRPPFFRLNQQHPLWNDCKLFLGGWGAGCVTAFDSSVYGNHGTLTDMDPKTDTVFDPELGRWVWDFDGTDDWINIGHAGELEISAGPIAVGCWTYDTNGGNGCFTRGGSRDNNTQRAMDLFDTSSQFRWHGLIGGGEAWKAETTTRPALNQWNHVLGVWDGGTGANAARLYVNGNLAAQATPSSATVNSGHDWGAGGQPGNGASWLGRACDFIILTRTPTPAEIRLLANRHDPMLGGAIETLDWAPMIGAVPSGGGPFPHHIRRALAGGMITMGI